MGKSKAYKKTDKSSAKRRTYLNKVFVDLLGNIRSIFRVQHIPERRAKHLPLPFCQVQVIRKGR